MCIEFENAAAIEATLLEFPVKQTASFLLQPQGPVVDGIGASADQDGPSQFLVAVRAEVHKLICTNDTEYADFRTRLSTASKVAIGAISTALANRFGIETVTVAAFVATILLLPTRMSAKAWCSTFTESPEELTEVEQNELSRIVEYGDAVE